MKKLVVIFFMLGIVTTAHAGFDFTGWKWQRSIDVQNSSGFVHLPIPPEVFNESQTSLNDLRVLDESSSLVPHIIHWGESKKSDNWSGNRLDC